MALDILQKHNVLEILSESGRIYRTPLLKKIIERYPSYQENDIFDYLYMENGNYVDMHTTQNEERSYAITPKGRKFSEEGGLKKQHQTESLQTEANKAQINSLTIAKIALFVSIFALIVSIIAICCHK